MKKLLTFILSLGIILTGCSKSNNKSDEISVPISDDWEIIQKYGFGENGISQLSFNLDTDSVEDCGDYYRVKATFAKGIEVPIDLNKNDEITITLDELENEKMVIKYIGNGQFTTEDDYDFYIAPTDKENFGILMEGSDDRIDCIFYEGEIFIKKGAKIGINIIKEYDEFEDNEDLYEKYGTWFNGVTFDEFGYATLLEIYGD